jgi:hypothetical protein
LPQAEKSIPGITLQPKPVRVSGRFFKGLKPLALFQFFHANCEVIEVIFFVNNRNQRLWVFSFPKTCSSGIQNTGKSGMGGYL